MLLELRSGLLPLGACMLRLGASRTLPPAPAVLLLQLRLRAALLRVAAALRGCRLLRRLRLRLSGGLARRPGPRRRAVSAPA